MRACGRRGGALGHSNRRRVGAAAAGGGRRRRRGPLCSTADRAGGPAAHLVVQGAGEALPGTRRRGGSLKGGGQLRGLAGWLRAVSRRLGPANAGQGRGRGGGGGGRCCSCLRVAVAGCKRWRAAGRARRRLGRWCGLGGRGCKRPSLHGGRTPGLQMQVEGRRQSTKQAPHALDTRLAPHIAGPAAAGPLAAWEPSSMARAAMASATRRVPDRSRQLVAGPCQVVLGGRRSRATMPLPSAAAPSFDRDELSRFLTAARTSWRAGVRPGLAACGGRAPVHAWRQLPRAPLRASSPTLLPPSRPLRSDELLELLAVAAVGGQDAPLLPDARAGVCGRPGRRRWASGERGGEGDGPPAACPPRPPTRLPPRLGAAACLCHATRQPVPPRRPAPPPCPPRRKAMRDGRLPLDDGIAMRSLAYFPGGLELHIGMFIPTLLGQGTPEQQAKWLPMSNRLQAREGRSCARACSLRRPCAALPQASPCRRRCASLASLAASRPLPRPRPAAAPQVIGTYAQTELGHGTFVRGLQTVAVYDEAAREFVVHSP